MSSVPGVWEDTGDELGPFVDASMLYVGSGECDPAESHGRERSAPGVSAGVSDELHDGQNALWRCLAKAVMFPHNKGCHDAEPQLPPTTTNQAGAGTSSLTQERADATQAEPRPGSNNRGAGQAPVTAQPLHAGSPTGRWHPHGTPSVCNTHGQ